jgi:hypothetical protein
VRPGHTRRIVRGLLIVLACAVILPVRGFARAAPPVITISPAGATIKATQASLAEAIDAFSRAAGFKVTYEGPRPSVILYNAEIDTSTVAGTLFRLIDGQNLNYAVRFDKSGKKVTSLLVLGAPAKTGGTAAASSGVTRPQPFTPPRATRTDAPMVEDDPPDPPEAEPSPTPSPTPANSPATSGLFPPSPFGPRPPFGPPFGPRPSPSPTPSP